MKITVYVHNASSRDLYGCNGNGGDVSTDIAIPDTKKLDVIETLKKNKVKHFCFSQERPFPAIFVVGVGKTAYTQTLKDGRAWSCFQATDHRLTSGANPYTVVRGVAVPLLKESKENHAHFELINLANVDVVPSEDHFNAALPPAPMCSTMLMSKAIG